MPAPPIRPQAPPARPPARPDEPNKDRPIPGWKPGRGIPDEPNKDRPVPWKPAPAKPGEPEELPDIEKLKESATAFPDTTTVTRLGIAAGLLSAGELSDKEHVADAQAGEAFLMAERQELVKAKVIAHFKLRVQSETSTDTPHKNKARVWRAKYKTHGQHHDQGKVTLKKWTRKKPRVRIRKNPRKNSKASSYTHRPGAGSIKLLKPSSVT